MSYLKKALKDIWMIVIKEQEWRMKASNNLARNQDFRLKSVDMNSALNTYCIVNILFYILFSPNESFSNQTLDSILIPTIRIVFAISRFKSPVNQLI